ncbi:MAG TPA: hypothetical protein VGO58_12005 [Chitinophagaceae bacterium]|jgi:hypothetical protein|nr:hypothetical protein [Chitinophagaceae bacterium]
MKQIVALLVFFFLISKAEGQFYIDSKGDSTYYRNLPHNDDPAELLMEIYAEKNYTRYIDTFIRFSFFLPDSSRPIRTAKTQYIMFALPELNGADDYVSITVIDKAENKKMDELVYDRLLSNKKGEYFNGNKNGIFNSAELADSVNSGRKSYKVDLSCGGSSCMHKWFFVEGGEAWFVVILAAKGETYQKRLGIFDKFMQGFKAE